MQTATIVIHRAFSSKWKQFLWFFHRKKYRLNLPESWADVRPQSIPNVCRILMNRKDKQQGALQIIKEVTNLKDLILFNTSALDIVEKLSPQIEWIFTELLTVAHLRTFQHKKQSYHMPGDDFSDFTFDEYRAADEAYTKLLQKGRADYEKALFTLLKTVLRTSADVSSLPDEYQFYVIYWFMCCKKSLYDQYFSSIESEDSDGQANWEDIKTDIAENAAFGNYKSVGRTNVHIIYKWLLKHRKRHLKKEANSLRDQILQNHQNMARV